MRTHFLEQILDQTIRANNYKTAIKTISLILGDDTNANLNSIDVNGKTFLSLALECSAINIANELLMLQEHDAFIIFHKDNTGKTLAWHAAALGNGQILAKLMKIAKGYMGTDMACFWNWPDNEGVTPLQIALKHGHEHIANMLLTKIQKMPDAITVVNKNDNEGKTALHQALQYKPPSTTSIAQLLNTGADINNLDDSLTSCWKLLSEIHFDKQTRQQLQATILTQINSNLLPLYTPLIANLPFAIQAQIIFRLDNDAKLQMANHYQEFLSKNPPSADALKMYRCLSGLSSLKNMLIGYLEYDERAPIRNFYQKVNRTKEERDESGYYPVTVTEEMIDVFGFNDFSVPLYLQKLKKAALDLGMCVREEEQQLEENWVLINSVTASTPQHALLSKDRVSLHGLLKDIEKFIVDFSERERFNMTNTGLGCLVGLACWGVTIAIMIGLYYAGEATNEKCPYGRKDHYHWNGFYLAFYILAVVSAIILTPVCSFMLGSAFCTKEINVSPSEWKNFLDHLQQEINKLKSLESLSTQNKNLLPTDAGTLQNLANDANLLTHKQPISQAINIFTQLSTLIKKLRLDMNKSNLPISFFAKHEVAINIPHLSQSANEKTPLLR